MSESVFLERIERAADALNRSGADAMIVTPSTDFAYLTGTSPSLRERLIALGITADGRVRAVAPVFELDAMQSVIDIGIDVIAWSDGDDPAALLVEGLGLGARQKIAIGADVPMRFTLEFNRHSHISWVPADEVLVPLRIRKSATELALLRNAASAVDETYRRFLSDTEFRGRAEISVEEDLRGLLQATGHDLSGSFSIVAAGPNAAMPHHTPGERVLEEGMGVLTDFGGPRDGYCSDMTRTWSLGPASARLREVHAIVLEANRAGLAAVRPGVTAESIDAEVRGVIERAGFGEYFTHRTGHGIGLDVHEAPYLVAGDTTVLEEGMAFSIEPGIYIPGELGVRIEDIVAVTADGAECLNDADRSLIEV